MTEFASHPTPRLGTVFTEQMRVVGLAVRREALVLGLALFAIGVLVLIDVRFDDGAEFNGGPIPALPMIALGALAPFAVWKGERVFDGAHLWTLPVERRRHALIKVAAGALWLVLTILALQLWLQTIALAAGGAMVETETRMLVGPGGVSDLTPVVWTTQTWEWAAPFTTGLICYLISSAFMLGVRYPLRWGMAAVAAFFALGMLAETELTGGLAEDLFIAIVNGPFGIDPATGGGIAEETTQPTGGRDVVGPEVLVLWYELPSLQRWAPAMLAWAAFATTVFCVALFRHRER